MKIFVTGPLGHIGSRLIREVPRYFPSAELVMIDNLSTQRYSSLFNLPGNCRYRFIEGDVLEADLTSVLAGVDAVIHLAAITDAAGSFKISEKIEHVNYNATKKVADSCVLLGIPMIHLSSTSVYGTQKTTVDEDCSEEDLKPQSPYAETKLKEERLLQEMAATKGLRFVTCRFGTIVGISTGMRFHTAVNKFCWQAVMGQPLTVWRTALHQKRPYLAIDDAIDALFFILDKGCFDCRIYNVLSNNMTVRDIVSRIEYYIPQISINYVDSEIMNQLSYEVLNERFQKLGFNFRSDIKKSIGKTIDLLRRANSKDALDR